MDTEEMELHMQSWGGPGRQDNASGRQKTPGQEPPDTLVREALVLAKATRDLVRPGPDRPDSEMVGRALRYASTRILHWIEEASRCGQHSARLKCLAEAACTNLAFRGLLYEEGRTGRLGPRHAEMLLSRSRRIGGMIGKLCESTGRAAAYRSRFERLAADPRFESDNPLCAPEAPVWWRY